MIAINTMLVIGIDPGALGALALREDGVLKDIVDMPVIEIRVGKSLRKRVNPSLVLARLRSWIGNQQASVFLEEVGPNSHDGAASAFAFGRAFGIPETAALALGASLTLVPPATWKRAMRCSADKNEARARACQLYPDWASWFARMKDHGRAEAALIADYGDRSMAEMLR